MPTMPPYSPAPHELQALFENMGFSVPETALEPLCAYVELLMQWNRVMNLVGTHTWQDTCKTLVIDSLYLASFMEQLHLEQRFAQGSLTSWDLGAGAGLPGIPLRTLWQQGTYCMVEAREKRALFLSTVLAKHPLPDTHVFKGRVEQFMAGPPIRKAHVVLSRAFMPWSALLQLVKPHLHPEALVILLLNTPVELAPDQTWRVVKQCGYAAGKSGRTLTALTPY